MRKLVLGVAIAAGLCGSALGENEGVPRRMSYETMPTGKDFDRLYPPRALGEGLSGTTVMCCKLLPDRTYNCTLAYESPAGYGFGAAALEMSKKFRMTPESYEMFKGEVVRTPITFLLGGPASKEAQAQLDNIREATQDICKPGKPVA
ncbi:MAG TPA: hypothetical protein VG735_08280 [Caulobacterales bacterium]|nr:hypothetical protein [Caulobacterales bacterium]